MGWVLSVCLAVGLSGCGDDGTTITSSGDAAVETAKVIADAGLVLPAAPPPAPVAEPATDQVANSQLLFGSELESSSAALPKQSQLIKNAEVSLIVDSVEKTLPQISALLLQKQGDLLSLQTYNLDPQVPVASAAVDSSPAIPDQATSASLQLRIPQDQLELTLDSLAGLGEVEQLSITAQDVSNQLVDFEARLRNLRKAEETVLGIMNRSGSIAQVLEVTRELTNIRAQIEQIDAQLSSLRNQVAYSRITLQLQEKAVTPLDPSFIQLIQTNWQQATSTVGEMATGFVVAGVWLVAYSPFLIIPGVGLVLIVRLRRRGTSPQRG